MEKICPLCYAQVTRYGACAVAPNALLIVAYGNVITHKSKRIVIGSSNLVEGLITSPAMYDQCPGSKVNVKVTRSHNVSAATTL